MAEDHAADDPIVKCPCCQLELNFGRDAKLFDEHYRACKREKKKLENDGKSYLVPQMCPQCGKTLCSKQSLDNHLKVWRGILSPVVVRTYKFNVLVIFQLKHFQAAISI